jgi:hypothetical protein
VLVNHSSTAHYRTVEEDPLRNDVTFVVIMIAFFALAALFVVACDKIIGSDDEALAVGDVELTPAPESESLAA